MHSEGHISTEMEPPKFDSYEEESDLAYQPESDQFASKPDEVIFKKCSGPQHQRNDVCSNEVNEYQADQDDYRAEAETVEEVDAQTKVSEPVSEAEPDIPAEFAAEPDIPAEFANQLENECAAMSHKTSTVDTETLEQYSHESSTFASENFYQRHSETPEQNRYSSASTVELDNPQHSSENISNIDQFEADGTLTSSPFKERYTDIEDKGSFNGDDKEDIDTKHSENITISADDNNKVEDLPEHDQCYSNGYNSGDAQNLNYDSNKDILDHAPSINGQHFSCESSEATLKPYTDEYASIISNRVSGEQDPHYQSDSPEDKSMRNDSPPEVPSPAEPALEDPLTTGSLPGYDGINKKLISGTEGYGSDNLNCMSTIPTSPKTKFGHESENPYSRSSEDEDEDNSLPGNVSPYAYTNKAYTQEDDADGNHIYKQPFPEDGKTATSFDVNNPLVFSDNTQFDSHRTSPGMSCTPGYPDMLSADSGYDFRLEEWGKPMGLPTPPESGAKVAKKPLRTTPSTKSSKVADKKVTMDNGKSHAAGTKLTNSPLKKAAENTSDLKPIYVDLAYVPHHGDPNYSDVDFFKKIRARYYVFSGIGPSKEVLNALLEAKKSWKEDLEVTIIPTYETDTLGYWLAQNQDILSEYSIEVAPSASRCTVNLQDHETSCAAYRLEF